MRKLRELIVRLGGIFNKQRKDSELEDEIESHLQLHIEDNLRLGMTPEEARREAMIKLGGIESTKEAYRDQRGLPVLETLWQDIRYGARMLRKNPGFTTVAVLTLALGIGANAVMFSVGKTVLFRPLGFVQPDQLVWLRLANTQTGTVEDRLSWREVQDIRESTGSFESVTTFGSPGAMLEEDGQLEEISALRVTPNLGEVLRIRPILGRMLLPSDVVDAAVPVVLISYELWQSRFGGSPDVLGKILRLDHHAHSIVGVLPADLQFPVERAPSMGTGGALNAGVKHCWLPMAEPRGEDRTSRNARMFLAIGRLKPKVAEASARAELAALGHRLAADHPETNRHWTFDLLTLRDQVLGRTRQGIPLLGAAVAAVLLICCVNLANLLLARGVTRQRELAVRVALGAGRRRLVRTLMIESTLLALLGGSLGVVLAKVALHAIRALGSTHVPFIREAAMDGSAIAFTVGLSLLSAFLFGLLPALRQSRIEAAESLRTGTRTTGGAQMRAWQAGLLVGQIALVLMLLASAGLLLESFRRLMAQDLGYQPQSVIALDLNTSGFDTNGDVCRMYRVLRERLAALPGVEAVGTISSAPLTGKWTFNEKAQVVGQPVPEADRPSLAATFVAFDYFQAMGIPLLEGRFFRDAELNDDGYGQIVILNESAAAVLFPGRSALRGRFTVGSNPDRVLQVVGVVKDTRDVRLEQKPQPRFYWQYAFGGAQVVIRGSVSPQNSMSMLRHAVQEADSRVRLNSLTPLTEIVYASVAERRFLMIALTTYAGVALAIAAVGIWGLVAYQVAQRTNEFGVRVALGATPGGLTRLVLAQTARLMILGMLLGLLLSLAAGCLLASQLFGLSPHNPALFMLVCAFLLSIALLACWLPAHRAARVDPMAALRQE